MLTFGNKAVKSSATKSAIFRLTTLVEKRLPLNIDDVQVIVSEIECNDPSCVPIETLIILNGKSGRWTDKILAPATEVSDEDISRLNIPKDWQEWIKGTKDKANLKLELENNSINLNEKTDSIEDFLISCEKFRLSIPTLDKNDKERASAILATLLSEISNVNVEKPDGASSILDTTITPTIVPMKSRSSNTNNMEKLKLTKTIDLTSPSTLIPPIRHNKGVRQRGCPCCDPDNLDNIVDNLLFMKNPP